MTDIKAYACYEDFGAVGDGVHDDLAAIIACHAYANAHGLPVRARDGAVYYIGGSAASAQIRTDTDFGTAAFTIDDRVLEDRKSFCFEVVSDHEPFTPDIQSVQKGQKTIDFPHSGTVLVHVEGDPATPVYVRRGLNQSSGSTPAESFIVDGEGHIHTDINWDYPVISRVTAICTDDPPITVKGGIFTTIANHWKCEYAAHNRGFSVTRSHVTVENMTHYVTDELPDAGAPYSGFLNIGQSLDVTIKNCTLTPHFTYWMKSAIPGQMVPMGTYDLTLKDAIGTKLIGLRQSRSIHDWDYWGLMGSNFCKDMELTDCVISRFDAHCGVTNCTIRDCVFGFSGVNIIGYGVFVMENTTVHATPFLRFREDYGSTFDGELRIRSCRWIPLNVERPVTLFNAGNTGDHDFGYPCVMGTRITIEDLTVDDSAIPADRPMFLLPSYDPDFSEGKPFALGLPETIRLTNVQTASGRALSPFEDPRQFRGVGLLP